MQTSLAITPDRRSFDIHKAINRLKNQADWVGLRYVSEAQHTRRFRNQASDTHSISLDVGVMVEAMVDGHSGYAGTSDLAESGLDKACQRAVSMAKAASKFKAFHFTEKQRPKAVGQFRSPVYKDLSAELLADFSETLRLSTKALTVSDLIVASEAEVVFIDTHFQYVSSNGSDVEQKFLMSVSHFGATAKDGNIIQSRSDHGPRGRCLQTGVEAFDRRELIARCEKIGREAVELVKAPNCPTETMDLLLDPDQMLIQIHESIGHPLEYDRILGDERNYAGWSFVKPTDFGSLKYGSQLMNITFDPSMPYEFASYAFDDCGNPATKEYLIKDGTLQRGLGSLESQARLSLPGVANFRSSSWNRAPIDRMANINLEPGTSSVDEMIAGTEKGIYMKSNISWSIDDYRNKFQFGCEHGQLIENGKLTGVVRSPNYRGVTVPFWNNLKAVGRAEDVGMFGSPFCGKGEPSQVIRVGHASPPCLFSNIEVFGGG